MQYDLEDYMICINQIFKNQLLSNEIYHQLKRKRIRNMQERTDGHRLLFIYSHTNAKLFRKPAKSLNFIFKLKSQLYGIFFF